MSEEYVVVNVFRSEEKVEEIPQTSEVSTEQKQDLRAKLLSMIDEALSLLDKIQPVPGVSLLLALGHSCTPRVFFLLVCRAILLLYI